MNRMRLKIAQRLKDAQNTNAMLTTFNEIDMRLVLLFANSRNSIKFHSFLVQLWNSVKQIWMLL